MQSLIAYCNYCSSLSEGQMPPSSESGICMRHWRQKFRCKFHNKVRLRAIIRSGKAMQMANALTIRSSDRFVSSSMRFSSTCASWMVRITMVIMMMLIIIIIITTTTISVITITIIMSMLVKLLGSTSAIQWLLSELSQEDHEGFQKMLDVLRTVVAGDNRPTSIEKPITINHSKSPTTITHYNIMWLMSILLVADGFRNNVGGLHYCYWWFRLVLCRCWQLWATVVFP